MSRTAEVISEKLMMLSNDWQAAQLLKPWVVKPIFATIEHKLMRKHLRKLQSMDESALRAAIHAYSGDQR